MFAKRRTYHSWFKMKNMCAKCIPLIGTPSPLCLPHTCPGLPTNIQWYIGNPKLCCFGRTECPTCYTLSIPIPSHCTMGWSGQTGIVPKCPTIPHCPSHPTVLWDAHNIGSKCMFTQSKRSCSYMYLLSQMIMTLIKTCRLQSSWLSVIRVNASNPKASSWFCRL